MSNRAISQNTQDADMRASHLAQIDVLLDETLTRKQKVQAFCAAASVSTIERALIAALMFDPRPLTAARICWVTGLAPNSLFANLPDCECPVVEASYGRLRHPLIPYKMTDDWSPAREVLEAFSQVQIEARYGK